jgi:hypothetical protein
MIHLDLSGAVLWFPYGFVVIVSIPFLQSFAKLSLEVNFPEMLKDNRP